MPSGNRVCLNVPARLIRQLENAVEIARDTWQVFQEHKCLEAPSHRPQSRSVLNESCGGRA